MMQRVEQKSSTRRGASLIEAVVVISMSSVMLGLGVGLIHLLMNVERATTKSVWHDEAISRLSVLFRQDVHAAQSRGSEQDDPQPQDELELQNSQGGTVAYRVEEHNVTRVTTESGDTKQTDVFNLPVGSTIRFVPEQQDGSVRLIINLPWGPPEPTQRATDDTTPRPATTQDLHVVAMVARDHRFTETDE